MKKLREEFLMQSQNKMREEFLTDFWRFFGENPWEIAYEMLKEIYEGILEENFDETSEKKLGEISKRNPTWREITEKIPTEITRRILVRISNEFKKESPK